jgi:L-lactate dehydrogenase complex protein LldG
VDARTEILARVRAAQRSPEPRLPAAAAAEAAAAEDPVAQFESELRGLTATLHRADSAGGAALAAAQILSACGARRVVAWNTAAVRALSGSDAVRALDLHWIFPEPADDGGRAAWRRAAIEADVGVTEADFALADTGTLVVRAGGDQPALASLLPSVHIALVARDRLLPNLDALLTALGTPPALGTALTLITGPSRTADIEKKIVLGVHGPEALHVILLG